MINSFLSWAIVATVSTVAISLTGCLAYPIYDSEYLRGTSTASLHNVEIAKDFETSDVGKAETSYRQLLKKDYLRRDFVYYQEKLSRDLEQLQGSQGNGMLSEDSGLGIPENFERMVKAHAEAHLGLARVNLRKKEYSQSESEALEAIKIAKKCQFCTATVAHTLLRANRILQDVYSQQGVTGRALISKLNADLLEDHLTSAGGIQDYYAQQRILYGDTSQKQLTEINGLFQSQRDYQQRQAAAATMAVATGLTALNATLQPNSASAQMQFQTMKLAAAMTARSESKLSSFKGSSPWSVPTFTRQLVDPKQGANTPSIMKGFASDAAQAGGTSYQSGAQQVTQGVDALSPYRESGNVDGAAAQIEKFADVFNTFLIQVQDIKR